MNSQATPIESADGLKHHEIQLMSERPGLDASPVVDAETTLNAAKAALRIGLRPIPIYAIGEKYKYKGSIRTSDGKPPIGGGWGKAIWSESGLEKSYGQNPERNVGLLMGPQGGIIDIEMDRPADMDADTFDRLADEELAKLCGGEIPETVGWRSGRGVHRIFRWDDRLGECTKNAFHHGRLEIRLGVNGQTQSVIPPSRHATGERTWLDGSKTIASLPGVAIERIIDAAKTKLKAVKPPASAPASNGTHGNESKRLDDEAKRLLGMARSLAQNIQRANRGDANTGRHPTALASARAMAGLIAGHCRDDLAPECRSVLIEAYRDSKPELSRDDPEFEQCIGDGWNNGTANPITLDERGTTKPGHGAEPAAVMSDGPNQGTLPQVVFPLSYNDPSRIFAKIIPHLADAGVYYRDGSLCRIVRGDSVSIRGVGKLSVSGPAIDIHDVDSILPELCRSIDFLSERMSRKGEKIYVPDTPKPSFLRWFLRSRHWPGTPHLAGIASGPFLRHDGTVCTTPGYDAASGWYLDYDGEPIDIPENPTRAQAEDACRTLLALADDFEWKSEAQKCGFLAYLLTLAARPGIEGAVPAFVFTASAAGAGKTLLVNVANIIVFGHPASGYSPPQARHESDAADEWKKMLFAFAGTGNPSLVVSNYPSGKPVGNAAIDGMITDMKVIGRPLGTSKTKESAWVATMAFTGNNLSSTADFSFRSIWSVLEPSVENPRERTGFKIGDLEGFAREHRADYLRKVLIILRWHAASGKPHADNGKHFGSFERWAETVRDAIMHLTGHDVTQNGRDAVITDQESDELGTLLAGLHEYFEWRKSVGKSQPSFTVAELHADLNDPANSSAWSDLRQIVDAGCSLKAFSTTVGRLFAKYKGRVSEGLKLTVTTVNKKHYWRVFPIRSEGG